MAFRDGGFPPPSKPIKVDGGISVRSKRGAIGETWWSKRFIEVLESLGIGGRITRGRTYARAGQVLDLEVAAGSVAATVQGSRRQPYHTWVETGVIWPQQWERIEQRLAEQALYCAKLLAGEMPRDIDEVFVGEGLALFPASARDLGMDCSCPDGAIPCKHLAAMLYVFAEALDDDPFLLMAWRGRDKDSLLTNLRGLRRGEQGGVDSTEDGGIEEHDVTDVGAFISDGLPALEDCLDQFWAPPDVTVPDPEHTNEQLGDHTVVDSGRPPGDGVLRHLDRPSIEVRGRNLADLLRPAYHHLTGS